jgi:hypothetical protein
MAALVTGIGVVSSIGGNPAEFRAALQQGKCGCALHEFTWLDGKPRRAPAYVAVTPQAEGLIEPRKLRRMFRLARMAAVAARQALNMAGVDPAALAPRRIGIVFGTAFGALEITQKFIDSWMVNGQRHASPLNFMNSVHGILASQIALDIGATGVNLTICQRDISFEAALAHGLQALEAGRVDLCLVGGADELTPLFHEVAAHSFYASLNPDDASGLDPRASRGVLVPGDGAAVCVLQREGKALARLEGASVGRHDQGGTDLALNLWQELGRPALDLVTNNRDGHRRVARLYDRREKLFAAPAVSHRGNFGTWATAGALQFAANTLMLAHGEYYAPLALGRPMARRDAPRVILHDAASTSGVHAAYVLTGHEP